ncbi:MULTISPECIES: restriction endonuclease [Mycobacterium]|uniref:restriction endonuclease n=1 Tax=Mycobacterium TaxID=1763 RepID=UPI0012FF4B46|nr:MULTISPECIES: restriction endonuclease [Mycobacterium]
MKRISPQAYQALRDALPTITWYKRAFESFLRDALHRNPELLAGLDFNGATKRETADTLISRLVEKEPTYHTTTIQLMLDVGAMTRFPDVERIKEPEDRALRLREAHDAVGRLRTLTAPYREAVDARAKSAATRASQAAKRGVLKQFSDDLRALHDRYVILHSSDDPHGRGKKFELLLTDLFLLFDMEPRLSYSLAHEQIDGSLSFDTDDYIVEARWRKDRTEPGDLEIFKGKVERKGRNALGIFISVAGFTAGALDEYATRSPFVVFTGDDIYMVLDGRIRLDQLLRAKKRHVNETGNCHLPARILLG